MSISSRTNNGRRFFRNERGNVALIFAGAIFVLAGMVGLAIDYGRLTSTRQELQSLADNALVAAATSAKSSSDYQTTAANHFNTNWDMKTRLAPASIKVSDSGNNELSAVANTVLPMTFMKVLGFAKIDVGVKASIVYGQNSAEMALVLDTTGSMSGAPLQGLQSASKTLLDTVYATPGADQKVRVSVVPFAQYVNVGTSNRNASWMNVPKDTSTTTNQCSTSAPIISQSGCSTQTATGYNDGVPYTYQYQQCTNTTYGQPVTTCGPQTSTVTWNGCAGSRNYPLDNQAAVGNDRVPGVMNVWCGSEVLRLTKDRSTIDAAIDGLTAGGDTFIPAGLLWGWRTLSPDAPYADATSSTAQNAARKVLVLMTDGANTRSPNYPDHEGYDAASANTLMAETCAAIKAAKITVYTVAFNVTDQAAKDRLTACASSASQFFDAPSASELKAAFEAIGKAMAAIYLKS